MIGEKKEAYSKSMRDAREIRAFVAGREIFQGFVRLSLLLRRERRVSLATVDEKRSLCLGSISLGVML